VCRLYHRLGHRLLPRAIKDCAQSAFTLHSRQKNALLVDGKLGNSIFFDYLCKNIVSFFIYNKKDQQTFINEDDLHFR
jgi:hypothetical protein